MEKNSNNNGTLLCTINANSICHLTFQLRSYIGYYAEKHSPCTMTRSINVIDLKTLSLTEFSTF